MEQFSPQNEVWKDIPGIPYYQASSLGRIRSLDKLVAHRSGILMLKKGRILKPKRHTSGYHQFSPGYKMYAYIHRAVCLAFIGPPILERNVVNHKNGIKTDNRFENLEWVTMKENIHHSEKLPQTINGHKKQGKALSIIWAKKRSQKNGHKQS